MRQTYENNKRRIQAFKLTADLKDDSGKIHHFFEGYEYVEIGGIKWATCNVGAEKETNSGLYFAWGDAQGYAASQIGSIEDEKFFSWRSYKFESYNDMLKYNGYDLDTLEACDDAATNNMGKNWRMPTNAEYSNLLSATTNEWVTDYQSSGINGRLFTDKTDESKKLFFPAVGYCSSGSIYGVGSYGYCWSSSLVISNVIDGWNLSFGIRYCYTYYSSRNYGFPIRGVIK